MADLMACVTIFPIGLCRCIDPGDELWKSYLQQFFEIYIYLPLSNWFGCVSVWLTTVVSFERYFCVAYPLKAKYLWTSQITRCIIIGIYISGFLMYLPYFFLRTINDEGAPPGYTDWGNSDGAYVYSWIRMFLVKTIPVVSVTVLNALLLYRLLKINNKRKTMVQPSTAGNKITNRRNQLQMKATAMVVSISIVFVLCHSIEPFAHSGLYVQLVGDKCKVYNTAHRILLFTTNTAEVFSYASNFYFYCLFNKQFRGVLKQGCCPSRYPASQAPQFNTAMNTGMQTAPMAIDSVM